MLVTCGRLVIFTGTPVSSADKIDRYDITEILLKAALNTITLTQCWNTIYQYFMAVFNSKNKRITRWRNSKCLICTNIHQTVTTDGVVYLKRNSSLFQIMFERIAHNRNKNRRKFEQYVIFKIKQQEAIIITISHGATF